MKDRILVFPCGSEIAAEIHRAFVGIVDVELIGASSIDDHGSFLFSNYIGGLPNIASTSFLSEFSKILEEQRIDFIFPTHEDVAVFLHKNLPVGHVKIISPPANTCVLLRSKIDTYKSLSGKPYLPQVFADIHTLQYPVFLKPDKGQGGKGAAKIETADELAFYKKPDTEYVICEYLPGEEVTVDCYTNKDNKLVFCGARLRAKVANGISVGVLPYQSEEIDEIAADLNAGLDLKGCWFFQLKRAKDNKWKLLEIGPRIASSMAFYRAHGVNFPVLAYYTAKNINCVPIVNNYSAEMSRAFGNYYKVDIKYNTAYIDLDDCLIINDKLNLTLAGFILQCINDNVKVELITRHEHDLEKTLIRHRILNLFDGIHHLNWSQHKRDYIKDPQSIFIDNSFAERKAVWDTHKIPVFSPDMIEILIHK